MNYLKQAWLVLILALLFGSGLAGIQVLLKERIDKNKLSETFSQIPLLVPGATSGEAIEIEGKLVYRAMINDKQLGWVIPSNGQGFADRIEILLGLNNDITKITGVYVLDQKETPGLGNKIIDEEWRKQFNNKDAKINLIVTKSNTPKEDEISSITGATISSESVCSIVQNTIKEFEGLSKHVK